MHQICNRNPFSPTKRPYVQWNLRDGCSEKTKKQRRRNNLVDGEVATQRWCSSGVGGTKMQWRNGVARRRRRRCSGGHEQPPPRCSGDATVVKPGRTIGVQWKKKKKRFAMLYGGCSEKKKSQKVCAAAKRFGFFYNPTKPYCLG
ncbi:hypothetical protein DEO72_LG5g1561 [Vigna unguiculata]|uniref:Uncharacterized protein n=1 Tax=Vigna unguiculata TaxID=3917 RepID=A0A4D6LZS4_VIGUN|nr:hypothetical protein DEO72_LG5g1561 [Vigna unguiculata]